MLAVGGSGRDPARGAPALLEALVESATPLLATLNRLTQVYEDLARRPPAPSGS